jgi:hypothetical protein
VQVFVIQEYALPSDMIPSSPRNAMNLKAMEDELFERKLNPWVSNHGDEISKSISDYESIEKIIRDGTWKCEEARAVRITQMLGSELELTLDDLSSKEKQQVMYRNPAFEQNPDAFWDVRLDDGSFCRIPKSLHPSQWKDDDEIPIGMEFGCMTQSGEFHRLLATGSRHKGGLHTTVYERYSKI